ncbi:MAG: hypothetical protein GF308_13925 [Candidatus Heimdallarchaeota archaeon]|nr:hypothetical protein [Candidatus Heimdallarchaeota archaeon]
MSDETRISQMKDEILGNANKEADRILNEAKQQSEEILKQGREKAASIKSELLESKTKSIQEQEKQQIASINLQARKKILQKKEEGIREAFTLAEEKIKNFAKEEDYDKVIEALIVEAGVAIGGGDLIVKLRKEDKKRIKGLATLAKKITDKTGEKCSLKISNETINVLGGGISITTQDESITITNTFESRLNMNYREIRTQVARTLFGD